MAVMKFLVYVTCFCLSQDLVFCDDYGESGNKITLTPSIRGRPEEILWTHNGNKVLEYDGSEVAKYGSFKDRVDLDFETGQLTIRKLNSQDSGKYQSEIWINRNAQISSHNLTVLDALPEPQVTCELDETSHFKKLSCSVVSQTQPSYEWSGPIIKQLGPTLLVNEQEENHNSVYTCTVKNKAGSRTTDFTLQDCHTGRESPAVLVPVLIVTVLLIILLAVLAFYLYRRKKQKLGKSELKKMDLENGECDNLLSNVPTEAMPGSSEATLPCRTRLTAPKESIADKKWDQESESENAGETHEGQKLLKESPQSAITEKNKDDTGNTNGELEKNEKNSENADEAEENANSKADETDTEVESQKSLQIQEEKEKSQILKNESEDEEESPEEQIESLGEQDTKDADKNEEDQTPEEKKEKEEENEEIDSLNTEIVSPQSAVTGRSTVDTRNVAEQLHTNEKSSQDENGEQSIEQQNKSLCTSINEDEQRPEGEKEEEEKTEKENHEVTGRLHIAEPCNPPLYSAAPSDPLDSQSNLDISVPSSNLNMELENKPTAFFPQEEDDDDDGEQTDKSSESEQNMQEKNDVPEIKEREKNKLLKDCDVKNSDPDNTNNGISVPEDKKAETETNSFSKHAMKEDHSSEIREQYLNKHCTECDNKVYSEEGCFISCKRGRENLSTRAT
ncbi:myb-like protein X isoform X2 [Sinocyclocheilus rhinocerous]|uniref:myb-like protein X isoform X2 n=1 Tax=Sinocyclocheilus rhinocerous TaxID=307959 RepID=UPI0007B83965|nr:PREDICTED: myb-like protein X isoform X2 [Sinocyclocheilus rhinocerous]